MKGIFDIIIGLVFIIGGLSGKLSLIGTNSGLLLALVGLGILGWGVYKAVRGRAKK